jgi:hypothetical protein
MVADIPKVQFAPNFFMKTVLICNDHSQISEVQHTVKGLISVTHTITNTNLATAVLPSDTPSSQGLGRGVRIPY